MNILPPRAPAIWAGMPHDPPHHIRHASAIAARINNVMTHPDQNLIDPEDMNFLNLELGDFNQIILDNHLLPENERHEQNLYYYVPPQLVAAEQILGIGGAHGGKRYRRRTRRTRRIRRGRGRTRRTRHRR